MRTLDQVNEELVNRQKELQQCIKDRETIAVETHRISKQILELRTKKKDFEITLEKAKANHSWLGIEIKKLVEEYWKMKQGL